MKKPTLSKKVALILCLFLSLTSVSQNFVQPTLRKNFELKGDMLLIGNSVLGKDNKSLNDNTNNESISMTNIDIDNDITTLNSSSADLRVPVSSGCYRIVYAALYWGAILQSGSRANIAKVKLKLPGSSSYINITGENIYDANATPIPPDNNKPYACYADVTSHLTSLSNATGIYTVADVVTSTGTNGTTGLAAGWSLFVIYEDPTTTTKSISTYDGFSALFDGKTLDIPISGFLTPPSGVINLKFGFASLNGDKSATGSKVEISNGKANGTSIVTAVRPSNSFFNSSITDINGYLSPRNPIGSNSLGYDTGIEQLLNVNKSTVDHNATSATVTLQVAHGQANPVFSFFNAFEVDVIAPDIQMTKIVKDANDNDIGGQNVNLGDNLFYEISYRNIGNDHVRGMTIKDVLPSNVIFNGLSDLYLSNSGGATLRSYDENTRTIIFDVPNTAVEVGDPIYKIRLKVQVVGDCSALSDACSNEIKNQAFASYSGAINPKQIVEEGSFSSTTCNFGSGTSTNFLVGIDNCSFNRTAVLCNTAELSASDGYDSYAWSRTLNGAVIGRAKTLTVTSTGTYYVRSTSTTGCKSIVEVINVIPFGNNLDNPILPYAQAPYAGNITLCESNGKLLPNLFLCGGTEVRPLRTGITDATSIVWEKLNISASCPEATSDTKCANEDSSCSWSKVGDLPDYEVSSPGQYRITLNYGGCFQTYYFNVFQNPLIATVEKRDITCNTTGQITVNGLPLGEYEYSLDQGGAGSYQSSNVFENVSAGFHDVYAKLIGASNGCVFKVLGVYIQNRLFQVTVNTTQPQCNGVMGSITLQANNVLPPYYYSIFEGTNQVDIEGPTTASDYTFSDLNPGNYTVRVWTADGCDFSRNITISAPAQLTAEAVLTKPLTCTNGQITVNTTNGTAPIQYYVNNPDTYQDSNLITVSNPLPDGGLYTIDVVDSKGCKAQTSIRVAATPAPEFTIRTTDVSCYGGADAKILFEVSSNDGRYALSYNIDGSDTYTNNNEFLNLSPGVVYTPKLRYTLNGVDYCYDTKPTVTFTAATFALTASAGVSRLAGCGANGEGTLRITNANGGVGPYLYSFDNQDTWTTSNSADKMPGTYTLYVKDSRGCIFAMPNIILAPLPTPPQVRISDPVFNCDGTANATATIIDGGSGNYQLDYLFNGNPNLNTPPNVFKDIPSGSHTVSVTYKLLSVPTYSNLLKEDFGVDSSNYTSTSSPDASSPGINPSFCWERQIDLTKCHNNKLFGNGEYTVTSLLRNNPYDFGWWSPRDHTSNNPKGRFLAVDAGTAIPNNAELYRKTIRDIIPNRPIQVRFFATNLLKVGNNQPDASLTVELQDSNRMALSSESTGRIPKTNGWVEYNKTIDPGNNTSLDFVLRLELAQVDGIDFAVDDLEVFQLPESCVTQVDFPFEVPTGNAFSAVVSGTKDISCKGANDGEISIVVQNFNTTAGFDYSIDGGATWVHQTSSAFTISGLGPLTYTPLLRYDASGACPIELPAVSLNEPEPLTVGATVTSLATCVTGATIEASAEGGTAPYRFELRESDGVGVVAAFSTNTNFYDIQAGSYTVFAMDANGCTTLAGADVNVLAAPSLSAEIDPTSVLCYDTENQATIKVKVNGGTMPFAYRIDAGPYQEEEIFSRVGLGPHIIEVIDSNNCTATIDDLVIDGQLLPVASVSKALDCSDSPEAVISVNIEGGKAPFSYTVQKDSEAVSTPSPESSDTNFTYNVSAAAAGTYTFVITDDTGCTASAQTTVHPLDPITVNVTPVDPSCHRGSNGSVRLLAAGGLGPFTYDFNGQGPYSTRLYSGLSANIDYSYVVTDSNGCEVSGSVRLSEPEAIVGRAVLVQDYSCLQKATIEVQDVSGGTGALMYSIDGINFQTSGSFTDLMDGSYTITIKDANGCSMLTETVDIAPLNGPTDLDFAASDLRCPENKSNITITTSPVDGNEPFSYTILPGLPNGAVAIASGIDNLSPGTYNFQVTDAKGCTYAENYTIRALPVLRVLGQVQNHVQCIDTETGAIQLTVAGASSFTYSVNGVDKGAGSSPLNLTGLAAGTYLVEVLNSDTNCRAETTLKIDPPASALTFTKIVNPLKCGSNGSLFVEAVGGWGVYSYTLTLPDATKIGPQSSPSFSGLSQAGDYKIEVSDVNNCTVFEDFRLENPVNPEVSVAAASDLCYDALDMAKIVVEGSLGVAPYQYSIDGGTSYHQSAIFENLVPATYMVRVKDAYGCEAEAVEQIINSQIKLKAVLTKDVDCSINPDGLITGTISEGTPDYQYTLSVNGVAESTSNAVTGSEFSYTIDNGTLLSDTSYQFVVSDANGCTATAPAILVKPLSLPEIESINEIQSIYCHGEKSAAIEVVMKSTVGNAPYQISLKNNGTGQIYNYPASGLGAGIYTVTVTDAKGCELTDEVTISEPEEIKVEHSFDPVGCDEVTGIMIKGRIYIDKVSGGTKNYKYHVTGVNGYNEIIEDKTGDEGEKVVFEVVDFGRYELIVTDANGCSKLVQDIKVISPPEDLDVSVVPAAPNCAGGGSAIVAVGDAPSNITGTGPFHFAVYTGQGMSYSSTDPSGWYNEDPITPKQATIEGLLPGAKYTFVIHDEQTGCYYYEDTDMPILSNSTLKVEVTDVTNLKCAEDPRSADGTVSFKITSTYGSVTPVSYEIYNAETLQQLPTRITGSTTVPDNGSKDVLVEGLPFGNFIVLVKEEVGATNEGCSMASDYFYISESAEPLVVQAQILKNANCIDEGIISAQAQHGTGPYQYQVVPRGDTVEDAAWVAENTFTRPGSATGIEYDVHVKDSYGCDKYVTVRMFEDPTPVVKASLRAQCDIAEGAFAIDVQLEEEGIAPYRFSVDNAPLQQLPSSFSLNNLSSGDHTIEVKDANGCGNSVTVSILTPLGISPQISSIVTCPSDKGAITVQTEGGSGSFSYEISPIAGTLVGNRFINLPADTYTVKVKDLNSLCELSKEVQLLGPIPVTFQTKKTDVSCNGDSNGSILVTLDAGNNDPSYTYEISGPRNVGPQDSNLFSDLPAGNYIVKVVSGKMCFETATVEIIEPAVLEVDASTGISAFGCATDNTVNAALLTVNEKAGTGTGLYYYSINGTNYFRENTFSISEDTASPITAYVKDKNGCVADMSIVVTPLPEITRAVATINAAIDCNETGSLKIEVDGGSENLQYQLLPNGIPQSTAVFVIKDPGTYYFRVNDLETGCYFDTEAYIVPAFNTIKVRASATAAVNCFDDATGSLSIQVSDYTGAYSFEVLHSVKGNIRSGTANASTTNPLIIDGLEAGNYTVVVRETDSPYCSISSNMVTIASPLAKLEVTAEAQNDNCNQDAGLIVATAEGGTAPYQYQILPASAAVPGLAATGWTSTSSLNVEAGDYVVYVKDAKDCAAFYAVSVDEDASPVISAQLSNLCSPRDGAFEIALSLPTAGVPPYRLSIDGNSFQAYSLPNTISNLSSGTHTFIVKDSNGCGDPLGVSQSILSPLVLIPRLLTFPSCADNDAVVELRGSGGSGNYEFKLDSGSYSNTLVYSGLSSGSHTFYLKDTDTSCEISVVVNITAAAPVPDFALASSPASCNAAADGTISANWIAGSNGNPPYTYSLSGTTLSGATVIRGAQASNLFKNLAAGTYTVEIRSSRACVLQRSTSVVEPAALTVGEPRVVPFRCTADTNAMNLASISVDQLSGGSGSYSIYEFFKNGVSVQRGSSTTYIESDLSGGNYTVRVYDNKGCEGISSAVRIDPFIPMERIVVQVDQAIDCNNKENITVRAVDPNGNAINGLTYTLVDRNATTQSDGDVYPLQSSTTGTFMDLPIANYIITATDANGCLLKGVHFVNNPNTFELKVANLVDVQCFGGDDGSATISIIDQSLPDQSGPFTYVLTKPDGQLQTGDSGTSSSVVLRGLSAGSYSISVRLAASPYCSLSTVFTINQPLERLKLEKSFSAITCITNDGTISASGSGGWPGTYEYQLERDGSLVQGWSELSEFTALTAGVYTIKLRDNKACEVQLQQVLVDPNPIVANLVANKSRLTCFGDSDVLLSVQQPVSGGSSVYKYTLEATYADGTVLLNGPQSAAEFANLGVGSYRVLVSDSWNCSAATNTVRVDAPTQIVASLVKSIDQSCVEGARLRLSASGGTGPYAYGTDPNFSTGQTNFVSTINIDIPFSLVAAPYKYYVKDANGCGSVLSNSINVGPLEPLDFRFENDRPSINCFGALDGVIVARASGGMGNYVYSLLDAAGNALPAATQLSPGHFSQLAAGNYIVLVSSGDCSLRKPISISQPNSALTYSAVVTPVSCNGYGNGKVELNAQGGTGVIKYAISPDLDKFLDSGSFLNLKVDQYQVIIQDVKGCNHIYDFEIVEPAAITAVVDPLSVKQELCTGDKTGSFNISISGGNAPYRSSIDGDGFVMDRVSFAGLSGGKHSLIVKDAKDCELSFEVILDPSVSLRPDFVIANECIGNRPENKVVIKVDPSNNPADVSYILDGIGSSQASNEFSNLAAADHFVLAEHKNGCVEATQVFKIEQVDPLRISLAQGGLNEIVATVSGGSGVYQFTVNGAAIGSENKFIYFRTGDYTFTVTDTYGCTVSATAHFEFIDIVIPPIFTPNGDGSNDSWRPSNSENYPDIKFVVYDRYGREVGVFGAGQSWDGKYVGTELPMGDYWYILKLRHQQDDREFVGHFTLYR